MGKKFKRIRAFILDNWQFGLLIMLGTAIASALLLYKLGSLTGGLSADEFALQQQIAQNQLSLGELARNPLFLPYFLGLYIMQLTPFHGPTAIRSIGALFGVLGAAGLFYILRHWYTKRMAFIGTTLFVTSAWFLHTARYASAESSYLLLPLLIAGVIALQERAQAKRAVFAVVLFGLSALYIPGVIWFVLPAIIIKRQVIIRALRLQPYWFIGLLSLAGGLLLIPLVAMFVIPLNTSALHNLSLLLGLPGNLPQLGDILRNFAAVGGDIFAYSTAGPLYTVGHLPWFDVATTALTLIGIYQFGKYYKLHRSKLIAIAGGVSLVLIALGGPVTTVILLPFLFLFSIEGLKWLLDSWLSVFPRNPLARIFAISLVVVLVASIATFQLKRYFIAWPGAPETRAVFNKLP